MLLNDAKLLNCGIYLQVLKGVPGKPVVAVVRPGEIRCKLDGIKSGTKDQLDHLLSVNDHVKVVEGQWRVRILTPFCVFQLALSI